MDRELNFDDEGQMFLRFCYLVELAGRLTSGARLRMTERPGWKVDYLARFIMKKVKSGGWDLTRDDVRWLVNRVRGDLSSKP